MTARTVKVCLFEIVGRLALWEISADEFMKLVASNLRDELQAKAKPQRDMHAHQFYGETLVELLDKEVLLELGSSEIRGTLQGWKRCNGEHFKFYIQSNQPYEIIVDFKSFCSGAAVVRAYNTTQKTDPQAGLI